MPYTRQQLLEILRDLATELGRAPTTRELLARPNCPSPTTYVNHFGSWRAALAQIGLQPKQGNTQYTRAEMIATLKHTAAELGHPPSEGELRQLRPDGPDPATYDHRFGSWNQALEAADLTPRYHHTPPYDRETLLETLRTLADHLGKTPTMRELLTRPDLPVPDTYRTHFGNWNAALEAAGLTPNRVGATPRGRPTPRDRPTPLKENR